MFSDAPLVWTVPALESNTTPLEPGNHQNTPEPAFTVSADSECKVVLQRRPRIVFFLSGIFKQLPAEIGSPL